MFFICNPMYLLVLHFFKLQALQIELSRPGGVEEGSAKDSAEVQKYLCLAHFLAVSISFCKAAGPRISGSQTTGGGPLWS